MKRRIEPVVDYQGHESYPSREQSTLSRRSFLGQAVAAAAAGALASTRVARAAPSVKDDRQRIVVYLDRYRRIGGSDLSAEKVILFTGDKGLARWLRKGNGDGIVRGAMREVLRKVKADVLYDGKKLFRLERRLGAIVVARYRKTTGKRARRPDAMLIASRYRRRYHMLGGPISPGIP